MYRKSSSGWLKHFDFIILDLMCLQIAFALAYILRLGFSNPYETEIYRNMAVFLMFADVVLIFFGETFSGVLRRGYYKEFVKTIKHSALVDGLAMIYLFSAKEGEKYSRLALYIMWALYLIISYAVRCGWKFFLKNKISDQNKKSLLIVTTKEFLYEAISQIQKEGKVEYKINGVVVIDEDMTGQLIQNIPVVAGVDTVTEYICKQWVDEVIVYAFSEKESLQEMINDISEAGVTVHINLMNFLDKKANRQLVEKVAGCTVLTTSINYMSQKEAFYKRMLDVVGGLIGCFLTIFIVIIMGPLIYIASPGPIFFSQVRIGKNGRQFKIYKLRSMYMDAEERKKELMEQNRVKDGMMFKMDFDPRIIGNKILSDGSKKTGLGDFIRKTSLDEFPQFWNVLKGEMSLVGTRPPTVDEWEKYELHHRARLATKPGITGMWQVSGRSKITDFEEVVKLDTQYINEWSMGMDLRILFKTVLMVLKRDGSM